MNTDIRSQLVTFESSLQRYLPETLLDSLRHRPDLATARPCAIHLDALLAAVSTYLPRYLVEEQLRDPKPGQVSGQFREATIMFADISGFTAMSERLSRQGQQGAEAIANIVGDYFTTMLDIAAHQGGDLLKFGGDALLVAFFGQDHALAACRAAAQMQGAMGRFAGVEALGETFGLKMTVGLGSGPLFTANLGTRHKMEYTVMGEALANMAHAEDQAQGGEIYIDQATYQAARSQVRVEDPRHGPTPSARTYRLTHVEGTGLARARPHVADRRPGQDIAQPPEDHTPGATPEDALASIQETVTRLDALVPYLPPGLLDMLRFDPQRMASRERGEFRPVTVVFANFYGIEEIIGQLGPAKAVEITAILNAHFSRMQEIIDRYGGVIDKVDSYVVGHRIMALFGAPRAHVDDPERAVRAAWEMQAAMSAFRELETSAGVFALKQRIGINTGRVFAGNVGSDARHEYSVMGDEVNLTARLMSVAQEGQVLISQSTAAQIGTRFQLHEKAPVKVKGKSQPVPNYEVHGILERRDRRPPIRRAPLVGRDEEWQVTWRAAQQAMAGDSQVLDIHGEMGMGKSRIVEELIDRWTDQGGIVHIAACVSYGRHIPYAPWLTILRDLFSLHESDSGAEQQAKIADRLAAVRPEWAEGILPADWAPLIAQLLSVPMPESELLRSLDPKLRQQNLQHIVNGLLVSEAQRRPTLLVIDDIQWIDEASLALLDYLAAQVARMQSDHWSATRPLQSARSHPLLLCIAHRPAETGWLRQPHQEYANRTPIALQALSEAGSLALLESQLPIVPEDAAEETRWQRIKELILKNAQGNPLFIVEMAHALIENYLWYDAESGTYRARSDLDRVQVPDTVSRVILSRLDRLDEQSRNMLKVASVIGREFQRWLLQSVYPYRTDETEMESCLLDLCEKELLDRSAVMYLFRHVMTREVAYESLLYAERRDLHRRIARSIEAQAQHAARNASVSQAHAHGAREVRPHPDAEALAQHYTLAEEWPQALQYQIEAGHRARSIYANEDAIHRFREALRIAERVPDSEGRQLTAHEQLSEALATVGQYDEALAHNDRAIALVLTQGPTAERAMRHLADLFRQAAFICEKKSDYATAFDWLRGGLLALEGIEAIEAARIYLMGAGIYHRQADNTQALQWCQHSLDIAHHLQERDEASHPTPGANSAELFRVGNVLAHAYYLQGAIHSRYSDYAQAIAMCQRSLDLYEQLGDLPGAGSAHNNLANAHFYRGDWVQATEHYAKALEIKTKIGDVYECGLISNNLGGVYLDRGQLDQAEALYRQSLDTWQKLGSTYGEAFLHMNLAAVALKRRQWERAVEHLSLSQKLCQQIDAEDFVAEAHRYMAEAYLGLGQIDRAQEWATRSLQVAQKHEMKLEEGATRRVLGQIHCARSQWDAAGRELRASLALLESLDSQYQVAQTLCQLAQLHRDMGREDLFHQDLDRAMAILKRLGAQLDLDRARELI